MTLPPKRTDGSDNDWKPTDEELETFLKEVFHRPKEEERLARKLEAERIARKQLRGFLDSMATVAHEQLKSVNCDLEKKPMLQFAEKELLTLSGLLGEGKIPLTELLSEIHGAFIGTRFIGSLDPFSSSNKDRIAQAAHAELMRRRRAQRRAEDPEEREIERTIERFVSPNSRSARLRPYALAEMICADLSAKGIDRHPDTIAKRIIKIQKS